MTPNPHQPLRQEHVPAGLEERLTIAGLNTALLPSSEVASFLSPSFGFFFGWGGGVLTGQVMHTLPRYRVPITD